MVVEHTVADVKHQAVKIFGHLKSALNPDVRAENAQKRRAEHIVRVEFSSMGKGFRRNFHAVSFLIRGAVIVDRGAAPRPAVRPARRAKFIIA